MGLGLAKPRLVIEQLLDCALHPSVGERFDAVICIAITPIVVAVDRVALTPGGDVSKFVQADFEEDAPEAGREAGGRPAPAANPRIGIDEVEEDLDPRTL